MIGPATSQHKRNENGHPLCGEDQVGTMWEDDSLVGCRACQILLRLQALKRLDVEICYCSLGAHIEQAVSEDGAFISADDIIQIIAEPGIEGSIIYEGKVVTPPADYRFLRNGEMMNDHQMFWSYLNVWEQDLKPDIFPFNQSYRPRVVHK